MTKTEVANIFSGNLISLMNEFGYTQRTLSIDSGISESSISRYISGTRLPDVKALINISLALNCSIDDLLGVMEMIE